MREVVRACDFTGSCRVPVGPAQDKMGVGPFVP